MGSMDQLIVPNENVNTLSTSPFLPLPKPTDNDLQRVPPSFMVIPPTANFGIYHQSFSFLFILQYFRKYIHGSISTTNTNHPIEGTE